MEKSYILIETDNNDSTFLIVKRELNGNTVKFINRYFEIYILENYLKDSLISRETQVINASSQYEALTKFRKIYNDLYKRAGKDYYEKVISF